MHDKFFFIQINDFVLKFERSAIFGSSFMRYIIQLVPNTKKSTRFLISFYFFLVTDHLLF